MRREFLRRAGSTTHSILIDDSTLYPSAATRLKTDGLRNAGTLKRLGTSAKLFEIHGAVSSRIAILKE
jgi:hypothetical protein